MDDLQKYHKRMEEFRKKCKKIELDKDEKAKRQWKHNMTQIRIKREIKVNTDLDK